MSKIKAAFLSDEKGDGFYINGVLAFAINYPSYSPKGIRKKIRNILLKELQK